MVKGIESVISEYCKSELKAVVIVAKHTCINTSMKEKSP
jgi:hypothetical protein